jgi:hypothetical protein
MKRYAILELILGMSSEFLSTIPQLSTQSSVAVCRLATIELSRRRLLRSCTSYLLQSLVQHSSSGIPDNTHWANPHLTVRWMSCPGNQSIPAVV